MFIALTKSFCTGTTGELAGATKIDNKIIGKVRPMTKRISELYAQRTVTEGAQVAQL
jgi:branched-subunit amino acid aminotransferase/4-amino-4-deoxychorismate lyase